MWNRHFIKYIRKNIASCFYNKKTTINHYHHQHVHMRHSNEWMGVEMGWNVSSFLGNKVRVTESVVKIYPDIFWGLNRIFLFAQTRTGDLFFREKKLRNPLPKRSSNKIKWIYINKNIQVNAQILGETHKWHKRTLEYQELT